ncbi:MAG: endonuclease [Alphaproteobacteria bacterium]|nr:endonuclease [Alphaproteobacteria bacterium]MCB9931401.1 endonuclease [Alphaproteobacteria bacterium]
MQTGYDQIQMERAAERYRKARAAIAAVQQALKDGKTPLELDRHERVGKRLRRLGFRELAAELKPEEAMQPARAAIALADHDETARVGLERVLGQNNLTGVRYLSHGNRASRAVGRIRIRDASQRIVGYGTGFLVSPQLVLTNHHVLQTAIDAQNSQLEMDYEEGPLGAMRQSVLFPLEPSRFFVSDFNLDFALVAVGRTAGGTEPRSYGWHRLIGEEGKVLVGEPLNIIQHPNGGPKQIAFRDNRLLHLTDDPDLFLHYSTDTEPGSSGSPVFNDAWEVVALHHSGVPETDASGQIVRPIKWVANEGVRASRIVRHLRSLTLAPDRQRLIDEALTLHPRRLETDTPTASGSTGAATVGGQVAFTLPLQVSFGANGAKIDVGAPTVRVGPAPPETGTGTGTGVGTPPTPVPPTPVPPTPPEPPLPGVDTEYYDAAADREAARRYYADIDDTADPAGLYQQLSDLLRQSHERVFSYSEARLDHLYPVIDRYPDGLLRSVYSGEAFPAEMIIAQERALEALLDQRRTELLAIESTRSDEDIADELAEFEAALPFNCEHVVPQSWFDKKNPMRTDLHHLFTCESRCNSFRSNHPYTDFPDFGEAVRGDCGKIDGHNFEPGFNKGAVARATLYFLLRYPGFVNDTSNEFSADRIPILLDWHRQSPPADSPWELHRNATVATAQGNRNPLIDRPDWADTIAFARGLG